VGGEVRQETADGSWMMLDWTPPTISGWLVESICHDDNINKIKY
jgi:hypothetical protein